MYTIVENVRIVISLLKKHGIRHVVLSPGGSNIPFVQGVQEDPYFKCYSVVDERSAMYFAIGLYLELGVPIATSCTSAQATRNYIPGLTEAYYKHVPILAITTSKHPRYLMQEYMQCPIQTSLPIDAVKKSYSLMYISSANDRAQVIRTANEAILELTHHTPGPIQLNVEELDNETWVLSSLRQLPDVRCIRRFTSLDNLSNSLEGKKVMLLIGEHLPFNEIVTEAIERFCKVYDVVVCAVPISNYHGKYALNCSLTMNSMTQEVFEGKYLPNILISIGRITGDYAIFSRLSSVIEGGFEHWRVNPDGAIVDTYNQLTSVFEMPEDMFFNKMADLHIDLQNHSYYDLWKEAVEQRNISLDLPFSNLYAAQQMHKLIPSGSCMHFAILNSLRTWSYFSYQENVTCFSNVAAFGIDGCLSTMLGQSMEREYYTFLITGDLAFYYDMNALGIRHIKNNVRILLVNNNGGVEFQLGNLQKHTDVQSYIAASGHFKSAKDWAIANGFVYFSASDREEFNIKVEHFVSPSDAPILFELFTDAQSECEANNKIKEENMERTLSSEIKMKVKKLLKYSLGDNIAQEVKNMLAKNN